MSDSGSPGTVGRVKGTLLRLRLRYRWLDHAIRAYGHFSERRGNHLAGAVTYFSFLSFFPLIALAFSVLGYVVAYYPDARANLQQFLTDNLPGLVGTGPGQINVNDIASAKAGVGIVGLLGLLYSGLGWLDALRNALRALFDLPGVEGNLVVRKVIDTGLLVLLGIGALASVGVSSFATSLTNQLLGTVGLGGNALAQLALKVLAIVLAIGADTAVLFLIFRSVPQERLPWRDVLQGAVIGAVLIEILKLVGTALIARTTSNPIYGAFAIVVGLLVWMNFIARAFLLSASWVITGPVPLTSPLAQYDPLIEIPVLEADEVVSDRTRQSAARRLASMAGVAALVAVRRDRTESAES